MKPTGHLLTLALCLLTALVTAAAPRKFTLQSPSGTLRVEVAAADSITYRLYHGDDLMLGDSPLSLTIGDGRVLGAGDRLSGTSRRSADEKIVTPIYRKQSIEDKYNELTLRFKEYNVIFRAYDSGMAYRFETIGRKPFTVVSERAAFRFPADHKAYIPYVRGERGTATTEIQFWNSFENKYVYSELSAWRDGVLAFLPILIESEGGKKLCITEADLLDYPDMYLSPEGPGTSLRGVFAPYPAKVVPGGHNGLEGVVEGREPYIARFDGPARLPWRVVIVAAEDAELADNDLVYALATPAKGDFSWVKPGKVAWDWWNDWNLYGVDFKTGVNNDTYKYYIDFAAEHGIEYVIFDEGWTKLYTADLMQVVPEIDMPMLVDYAASKNVGIILWAGYNALNRDIEGVCRHYAAMGVKGFKVDFLNRDDQQMVDFHHRAAQIAARYGLMLDFHGTYKPAGLQRTCPNVINFEAVDGLEQLKWANEIDQVTYEVQLPFIRQVAGPMDYTQGAMRNASKSSYRAVNSEPMSQGTRCRQLAQYVVFESPLNMLCDSPSNYRSEPECLAFITATPTVWNETRILTGRIGEYIATARRSGETWYVGAMTDWNARELMLDLAFLGDGNFEMERYTDGPNADRAARDYRKHTETVPADRKITVRMAPGGGFAAKITPMR